MSSFLLLNKCFGKFAGKQHIKTLSLIINILIIHINNNATAKLYSTEKETPCSISNVHVTLLGHCLLSGKSYLEGISAMKAAHGSLQMCS